jgi:hypothetical protein
MSVLKILHTLHPAKSSFRLAFTNEIAQHFTRAIDALRQPVRLLTFRVDSSAWTNAIHDTNAVMYAKYRNNQDELADTSITDSHGG